MLSLKNQSCYGVKREKQVVFAKIKQLDEEKVVVEKEISVLEEELSSVTEKRDKILDSVNELRKQREEWNAPFYQNCNAISKAKVLATKKDVGNKSLEEIAKRQHAEERKKKQAEKAAAKAAITAQKEAEKKLKEFITFFRFYVY
ncbi:hypothetical protein ACS0TY_003545 [Phlomoides rotata]